ncbi:hypothetical protein HUN08_05545 [Gordonia sp. X0973]|uniref:hypothetical protein n=1 Tax=Gordonia sp. X0973 TaxID=2742602 RepID=UPI000F53888A|nr:hypothetical protein [Gordonia sp. X0973]QKT06712.1 hypothetical protein HUN08_05545 [Gordonia sp. X0973]
MNLVDLLDHQDGVLTRKQALARGLTAPELRGKLRRREWVPIWPGVYVTHNGPPTWSQHSWAAVLSTTGAALAHQSALRAAGLAMPRSKSVHIVVGRFRTVTPRAGIVVHHCEQIDDRVLWNARPPRLRVEHAVLDVAESAATEMQAIASIADAVQARVTTAARLSDALAGRSRVRRRKLLQAVLADTADGACSVLEHEYLRNVERAHRLPRGRRQARTTVGRPGFRDVDYDEHHLIVELDGRFPHDSAKARDRDMERDLDAAVGADRRTLRLGWGQVYERPCGTALKVATMLRKLGWAGTFQRCPKCGSATD